MLWTGLEFAKNVIFFNANRNIQKLSYFMPVDVKAKSITNSLFNDWNELFYSDNFGLSTNRFITSYTEEMDYILEDINHQNQRRHREAVQDRYDRSHHRHRYVRVDERDDIVHPIDFHDEFDRIEDRRSVSNEYDGDSEPSDPSHEIQGHHEVTEYSMSLRPERERRDSDRTDHSQHSMASNLSYSESMASEVVNPVVPNPKYWRRCSALPLPTYRHFMLQNNTLFAMIMLHCTLLPASRMLLQFNHLFLPNTATRLNPRNKFENLQSMTSHKGDALNQAATQLMKLSNIVLSHTYCMLHVAAASVLPVFGLRGVIFGNLSPESRSYLNPMHLNHNANMGLLTFVVRNRGNGRNRNNGNGDDGNGNEDELNAEDREWIEKKRRKNASAEFLDRWSLSNHLTSISLMLSMVPYVNNFYAMISVFSFGMTLGEGEDIMGWTTNRLHQNNVGNARATDRVGVYVHILME